MKFKSVLDEKGLTVGVEVVPENGKDCLWLRNVKNVSLHVPYTTPVSSSVFLMLSGEPGEGKQA